MKKLVKKSVIMLVALNSLFLASCTEDIQEPKRKIQSVNYGEGDDPLPPPIGGDD